MTGGIDIMANKPDNKINRRNFLRTAGLAGVAGVIAGTNARGADTNEPNAPPKPLMPVQKMPRRKLGKTGVEVPILALGGIGEQVVFRQALDWGVTQWDTALVAGGGNSEIAIGQFFAKNPDLRKDIFLVTKESKSKTADDIEKCLQTSLKRLNTSYIDFYCGVYMISDPDVLTDEVKKWAEGAKKRGVIKYFGFSTHQNMPQCLQAASKLDWIDAIQTSYNFRLMQDSQMQDAIEACYKAGIGIIAMKTQGMRQRRGPADTNADPNAEAEADRKMLAHFLQRGFTEGQAKIKAVLQDERISSVCSAMNSTAMLMTNIAAALDKTKLEAADWEVLRQYALETCSGYCAGCAHICEQAAAGVPISDVMRALMYHNSYGDKAQARQVFAEIPAQTRQRLLSVDYTAAESRCPNRMPIARLMADAVNKLA